MANDFKYKMRKIKIDIEEIERINIKSLDFTMYLFGGPNTSSYTNLPRLQNDFKQ